jgi:tetratricopeptide (TPR) repeat protein
MKDLNGNVTWMGHYQVLTGYDDTRGVVIAQDSYYTPDYPVSYDELVSNWRSFNYIYLVVYPADQEAAVMEVLGPAADEVANYQAAAELASDDIYAGDSSLLDTYFAWFNRGSSLVRLQDFGGAAQAYDQASAIYATIPEKERPYRMLWYQTGPYFAYYYTGRHYDVINLATLTLKTITKGVSNLEESYYWRARSYQALGDLPSAIDDLETSLRYHPGFAPSLEALASLGVEP